ncbi:hypothetical protein EUGRSUZ_B00230 [Eucalyptus grandis]|uniref:Uncharacterized protein n=2 Tax=Eucalyptus grandis TaxID=71139 RepID=A0A059CXU8_EUCGR|nr:hypothetical protein EUGRSUZ_B00230 [Eucalyptus grandis]
MVRCISGGIKKMLNRKQRGNSWCRHSIQHDEQICLRCCHHPLSLKPLLRYHRSRTNHTTTAPTMSGARKW